MRARRPLDLLDAAYRLDGSDDEWMANVVSTMGSVFADEGCGAGGFVIAGRIDEHGRTVIGEVQLPHVAMAQGASGESELLATMQAYPSFQPQLHEKMFFSAVAATTVSVMVGAPTATGASWEKRTGLGIVAARDAFGMNCHAGPLDVLVLSAPLREVTAPRRDEERLWTRIATHVGAAYRLRRAVRMTPDRADAAFSADGKIAHLQSAADGPSIEDGFARRRHARTAQTTPESALEIWQGLHDGRWSLVDYIDTDGKAFVLAVRNEPARDVPSTLTDRQRGAVALAALGYGNKQIGYALGLTAAAVAMLLARARAGAGVRTRAQLVRAFKFTLAGQPS